MSRYQLLPPLTDDERGALRDSIATFGVLQPIVVDEDGNIIDGHHRAEIAAELGVDCPRVEVPGLSEDQKIEQALVLNLARRHLSADQKQALVGELRRRGLSVRWISEQTGIPRSSVHRYAAGVPSGTPDYVTGQDGKRYRVVPEFTDAQLLAAEVRRFRRDLEAAGLRPDEVYALTLEEYLDLIVESVRLFAPEYVEAFEMPLDDPALAAAHYDHLVSLAAVARLRSGRLVRRPSYAWWQPRDKTGKRRTSWGNARLRRRPDPFEETGQYNVWDACTGAAVGKFLNELQDAGLDPMASSWEIHEGTPPEIVWLFYHWTGWVPGPRPSAGGYANG